MRISDWSSDVCSPDLNSLRRHPIQESQHALGDEGALFFQREVAGVEEVELDVLEVLPIALGEVTREQRVVVAPDHQGRRLVLAAQRLPLRIERDVVAVVVEQRELDRLIAGAVEQVLQDRKSTRLNSSH